MVMCPDILLETTLALPLIARGKVRDIYDLGENLLFVATDRISAFDCVLRSGIPCKGQVLTQMSLFWFDFLHEVMPSHLVSTEAGTYSKSLEGRAMIVKKAEMIPVECVARGYLAGSGWKEYQASGSVCGIRLPAGLREGDRLPEPIVHTSNESPKWTRHECSDGSCRRTDWH